MSVLKLNSTPIRTSENYLINDIELNDLPLDNNQKFDNVEYNDFDKKNIQLSMSTNDFDLTYGIGKEIENEIRKNANVRLRIELKGNTEKDNIITFKFDERNRCLIDDIEIIANEGLKGNLIIKYEVMGNDIQEKYEIDRNNTGIHYGIIRTSLKSNSNLKLTVVNLTGFTTKNIIAMENCLEKDAKLDYNIIDFGGYGSVTNYYSNLLGDNSENYLNVIYLGINKQTLDMNYIAETRGKKTKMNIDVQGAIKDYAKKHFKGTIDFKRGSKKAEGSENEFCMLLSDEAKAISLPMLLCDEEDVIGNHSTAAGKINNKELFYLMSRGLTEEEAKMLLIKAKFNKVIDNISNFEIRDEILSEIDYRLF